jgi:hypothetical protein
MSVVAFDTLKFAQTLRNKAKLTSEQAEGISEAFADAVSDQIATKADLANLATKQDIADLKKQDLAEVNEKITETHRLIADTNTKIVESKAETLKWVIGLSMAQIAAMFALFRLLPGGH